MTVMCSSYVETVCACAYPVSDGRIDVSEADGGNLEVGRQENRVHDVV